VALVQRLINVKFQLSAGKAPFPGGSNTVDLAGLRVTARILKALSPSMGMAELKIYGMTLSLMNQLATLGMAYQVVPGNTVTVTAGDTEAGMATVFVGTVIQAWSDFSHAPDVAFLVQAQTLGVESVVNVPATSVKGQGDVGQMMKGFADQMGCSFENNGVTAKLSNPYFSGSPRSQAEACAKAAGVLWTVDNKTLAMWPNGKSRGGAPLLVAKPEMQGYPTFTAYGLKVKTILMPALRFGDPIQVRSSLEPANGEWLTFSMDYELESQVPGGRWHTVIETWSSKFPNQPPVPQQ